MKEIQLTQGKVALVDDKDYEWLMRWPWIAHRIGKTFYADCHGIGTLVYMHRIILNAPSHLRVDHINRNGLDNRRENLRLCTHAENQRNRGKQANNTTGYKGVVVVKNKYRAYIKLNGKQTVIGHFETAIEAAKAYDAKAKELHGEFANLNFPD